MLIVDSRISLDTLTHCNCVFAFDFVSIVNNSGNTSFIMLLSSIIVPFSHAGSVRSTGLLENDRVNSSTKVLLSLAESIRFARPFENDWVNNYARVLLSLVGPIRSTFLVSSDLLGLPNLLVMIKLIDPLELLVSLPIVPWTSLCCSLSTAWPSFMGTRIQVYQCWHSIC